MNTVNTQTNVNQQPPSTGEKMLVRLGLRDPRPGLGFEAYEDLGLTKKQKVAIVAGGAVLAAAAFLGVNAGFDNDPSLHTPVEGPAGEMTPEGYIPPSQPGEIQVDHTSFEN